MTTFWIICALLLVVAVLFVGVPLWRGTSRNNAVVRDAANLEIYRDQLAEMDADLRNGLLTQELYEQGKRELEARLLDEVHATELSAAPAPRHPLKTFAIVVAVVLPLFTVGLYFKLGNFDAFEPQGTRGDGFGGAVHTQAALNDLEAKVAKNPNDGDALLMLARSYADFGRYADAARSYDKLTQMFPNEPMLWTDYADALAMTHNSLLGAPTKLLERALMLDANYPKALALSGTAAMERGDYAAAIHHWENLLRQIQPGTEDAKMIQEGLRQARQLLAHSKGGKAPRALDQINEPAANQTAVAGKERITGTVTLSPALKGQVDPNETIFVLARAAEGPKMPLAIVRKQVKDLPLQFSLDDSMAMAPEMKLSNFDRVIVVARISKSGDAMPKLGDLQGVSQPLPLGSRGVKIDIDQQIK